MARLPSFRMALVALPLLGLGLGLTLRPVLAEGASQPYTVVESGRQFGRLQDAVNAIGAGSGTIRIAAGRWRDCAVQEKGSVAFVAAAPGQAILERQACEGKAGLVLRGRSARVEGVIFSDFTVPDGNGAGIRLEHGDLAVTQSWFRNSQEGILTANDPDGHIVIDKSTFTRLGLCPPGMSCAHSIYTGDYGSLTVTRTRFEAGNGGHYVKSRAARVTVTDCAFDDSQGKKTNYMIDLSGGATGRISGNWFVQGQDKENYSAFIAIAAEGHDHSADGLAIENNAARFAPGVSRTSAFVADWSGDRLQIGANQLATGLVRYQRR